MKNHLIYQATNYTCAPTTMLNALRYLYEREELKPDIVWTVFSRTMDNYGADGTFAADGTSPKAMLALANALNMYGEAGRFPIYTKVLQDQKALARTNKSQLRTQVGSGAVGVARVWSNRMNGHYVLVTGFGELPDGNPAVRAFDPLRNAAVDGVHVVRIEEEPQHANRLIAVSLFDSGERKPFALVNDETKRRIICVSRTVFA